MSEGTIVEDKLIEEWLSAGEALYAAVVGEFRDLEKYAGELEKRISDKCRQVNQIARIIGKPPIEPAPAPARIASKPIPNPSADQALRMLAGARCEAYAG